MNSKPQLDRALGLYSAILLVISSMIGSGVFKKVAPMSAQLQDSNLVLLAWVLAGVVSMLGVFTYSGLASLTEEGGGQFEYFRIIYGRLFSFLFGWACFTVIQSASIASIAYVFAESVNYLFPLGDPLAAWSDVGLFGLIFPFQNSGVKLLTIVTIAVLTMINYTGVRKGGLLNNIFSSAKIAGILILIVAGLLLHDTVASDAAHAVTPVVPIGMGLVSAMFTAMLSAFWAYDGWINVSYIGGEIRNPRRNIPIAIIGGTALVMMLYVVINYVYLHVLPVSAFIEINNTGSRIPAAEVAHTLIPGFGYTLVLVLIMVCTFGATNASLMASPRIYHRMAGKGLFFPAFGETHPKFHTPHRSLIFQMIWSILLVISGTFDQLTNMLVFASFLAYGSGAAGLLYMKYKGKPVVQDDGSVQRLKITARVIGFPVIPIIFLLFCIALVVNTLVTMPQESLTGLGFISLGIPLFFLFRNKQDRSK